MTLDAVLRDIVGLPQPLDVLASADRDVRINAPRLLKALTVASAQEALDFADTLRLHRDAFAELALIAQRRASRLGMAPLPFQEK